MPWYQTRQVAKLIGVNESTVRENTAGFPAPGKKKDKKNNGTSVAGAGNPASRLSGAAAAKAVESVRVAGPNLKSSRRHPVDSTGHHCVQRSLIRRPPKLSTSPTTQNEMSHFTHAELLSRRFESVTAYQPSLCELRLGEADLAIVPKGAPAPDR